MSLEIDIHRSLNGFNLDVSFETKGKCVGILGASGCGKSMTLKSIVGIVKPDSGTIRLGEHTLFSSQNHINIPPQKRKVGYMFQHYALFPHMTVEQNIGIGVFKSKKEKAAIVEEQLERFHLKGLEKHKPSELSGGQQQRVALARIFAYEPDLILLDEPFSALDSFLKDRLQQQLFAKLRDFKGDIIMVSHSRDEVYALCDEVVIMDRGKSLLIDEAKAVFRNPRTVEGARLIGCKNISKIIRLSAFELFAVDWQIHLKTVEEIDSSIQYVGIRAHDIIFVDKAGKNTFKVNALHKLEGLFEDQYIVRLDEEGEGICIKAPKGMQIPLEHLNIEFHPEAFMLLK